MSSGGVAVTEPWINADAEQAHAQYLLASRMEGVEVVGTSCHAAARPHSLAVVVATDSAGEGAAISDRRSRWGGVRSGPRPGGAGRGVTGRSSLRLEGPPPPSFPMGGPTSGLAAPPGSPLFIRPKIW